LKDLFGGDAVDDVNSRVVVAEGQSRTSAARAKMIPMMLMKKTMLEPPPLPELD
jgi:hypothetical protein